MVDALHPSVVIKWGTTVTGAIHLSNGQVGTQLSNGEMHECNILIAADGSRSKIRSALRPEDNLQFLNTICITGHAKFDGEVPGPADKDWGLVLSGTGTGLFVGPVDEKSVVWNLSYLSPEPRNIMREMNEDEIEELIQEASERGKGFPEPFATYVKATDLSTLAVFNAMDKEPFAHTLSGGENGNVIFVGDSNHAVSPFAGNGANMALVDGWELAEQLCRCDSLQAAVAAYDSLSVPRSKRVLRFSHWTIWILHSKGWRYVLWTWMLWIASWMLMTSPRFR
jgi:2-polyprenyl-6-methoxyphenol hydroxylase-like FAD-dependent oxidoreductase